MKSERFGRGIRGIPLWARICLFAALFVLVFSAAFSLFGFADYFPALANAMLTPGRAVGRFIKNGVTGFTDNYVNQQRLLERIDELESENESMAAALEDAKIISDEDKRLLAYLSMEKNQQKFSLMPAHVIAVGNAGTGGETYPTEITIDIGSSDGIAAGMPVVTASGLVGLVTDTTARTAKVSTILSPSLSVGARLSGCGETGLCRGSFEGQAQGLLEITQVSVPTGMTVDETVVTSGGGLTYPKGLVIGFVTDIRYDAYSRTAAADIEPCVNFSNLTFVSVITGYADETD